MQNNVRFTKELVIPSDCVDHLRRTLAALIGVCCLVTIARADEPLSPPDFARLHALIKPYPGEEQWTRIPWLTNLWEARKRAAAEDKPILLWEMDGSPLGAT